LTTAATVGSGRLTASSTVAAAKITGAATVQAAAAGVGTEEAKINGRQPTPPGCEAKDGWPEVKQSVAYDFAVTPGGFKHDHKKVVPLETEQNGKCDAAGIVVGGSYTATP
jgi:hypothetical protein